MMTTTGRVPEQQLASRLPVLQRVKMTAESMTLPEHMSPAPASSWTGRIASQVRTVSQWTRAVPRHSVITLASTRCTTSTRTASRIHVRRLTRTTSQHSTNWLHHPSSRLVLRQILELRYHRLHRRQVVDTNSSSHGRISIEECHTIASRFDLG